jgi:hypothetical protein
MSTVKISEYTGNINATNITASKFATTTLELTGNSILSKADSEVFITLGSTGINFEGNSGDIFSFNSEQDNIDLKYDTEGGVNTFYIDASTDRIGIGTATPTSKLQISGDVTATNITASGNISASGTIFANKFQSAGGDVNGVSFTDDLNLTGDLTASGDISASGTISAQNINLGFVGSIFAQDASGNRNDFIVNNAADTILSFGDDDIDGLFRGKELDINALGGVTIDSVGSGSVQFQSNNTTTVTINTTRGRITASGAIRVSGSGATGGNVILDPTGHITASGNISASGNILATSQSVSYITASVLQLDSESLYIGGAKFTKTDVENLKSGRSMSTTSSKQVVHQDDPQTFVQMKTGAPGRVIHKVSNVSLFDMTTSSFAIGPTNLSVPITLQSSEFSITGSTSNTGSFDNSGSFNCEGTGSFTGSFEQSGSSVFTGSFEQSGSSVFTGGGFTVNNLLDLLTNFGQTGIPTGSGQGGVAAGDINLDGQVNITDMLLLLAGYGNPNNICNSQTIPPNVNHQFVGPTISICTGSILTISTGSFCSITL